MVRPGVEQAAQAPDRHVRRWALSTAHALLAHLVSSVPARRGTGRGRHAVVLCAPSELSRLDGRIVSDFLEADGWAVRIADNGEDPEQLARLTREQDAQLVVLATLDTGHLLRTARACALLRHLAEPPLVVACGLTGGDGSRRARSAGAEGFADDPDGLLDLVEQGLPAPAVGGWGVSLQRLADGLLVAVSGGLDEAGVARLEQVVESRWGTFATLVVDLREVAGLEPTALPSLRRWRSSLEDDGGRLSILARPGARPVLEAGGLLALAQA